jgi:hypothetical protein
MLLLFKTNDCLRHVERQLQAGAGSFLITLKFCLRFLLALDRSSTTAEETVFFTHNTHGTTALASSALHRLRAHFCRLRMRLACVTPAPALISRIQRMTRSAFRC